MRKTQAKNTIVEVAARAGVSLTTVSRVLNGNYPVKESTRQRVNEAVQALNYEPNAVAQSLKNQRTRLIGVVIPDISNPFFTSMIKGIDLETEKNGYSILVASTYEQVEKEQKILRLLFQRKVDAIVLATCQTNTEALHQITDVIPTVLADRKLPGLVLNQVLEDNKFSSYKAVEHLIQSGHRKIAILNGNLKISVAHDRYEGYLSAMRDYCLPVEDRYVLDCGIAKHGTQAAIERLVAAALLQDPPTAVFATSNMRAQAVIAACAQLGRSIPDDISLVSYGEIPNLFTNLQIAYIKQDALLMGAKAGELVLRLLADSSVSGVQESVLSSPLIGGNSVCQVVRP